MRLRLMIALPAVLMAGLIVVAVSVSKRPRISTQSSRAENPLAEMQSTPVLSSERSTDDATQDSRQRLLDQARAVVSRFRETTVAWDRLRILEEIPGDLLPELEQFLWEIAQGPDADNVRSVAILALEKLGTKRPGDPSIPRRLSVGLAQERCDSIRCFMIIALGNLFHRNQEQTPFIFEYIEDRLFNDESSKVREAAAGAFVWFALAEREKALRKLQEALQQERDAEVRKEIERTIRVINVRDE